MQKTLAKSKFKAFYLRGKTSLDIMIQTLTTEMRSILIGFFTLACTKLNKYHKGHFTIERLFCSLLYLE